MAKSQKRGKVKIMGKALSIGPGSGLGLLLAIGNRQPGPGWAKLGDSQAGLGQFG